VEFGPAILEIVRKAAEAAKAAALLVAPEVVTLAPVVAGGRNA
jgi:hypothetical protein